MSSRREITVLRRVFSQKRGHGSMCANTAPNMEQMSGRRFSGSSFLTQTLVRTGISCHKGNTYVTNVTLG